MALQNVDVNFEAFLNCVEASEKNNATNSASQKGFETPDCAEVGNKAIVRFVNGIAETALDQGKPGSGRAKLFNIGWVKDDNNKPFFLVLPAIINNKPMYPSTMFDFIDKVLSRTWVSNPEAKDGEAQGAWKYYYADRDDYGQMSSGDMTLKQVFWKVFKSGEDPKSQWYKSAKSWRGQTVYIANVIDRLDYAWHKEHKKTKLLMRYLKVTTDRVNRKELSYYLIGSPLAELTNNHGVGLNYDVLITPGASPTDKFNLRNVTRLKEKDYWDDVKSILTEEDKAAISTNPGFTEEEATWDPIDISKYYRFTSAKTILDHFGKTIKSFDMATGSDFYGAFEREAEQDKAFAETKKSTANMKAAEATPTPSVESPSQPTVETPSAPIEREAEPDTAKPDDFKPVDPKETKQSIDDFYSNLE